MSERDLHLSMNSFDILLDGQRLASDDDGVYRCASSVAIPTSDNVIPITALDIPRSPHSRANSFRDRPRPKLNLDIEIAQRPRTNSLPNAYLPLPQKATSPLLDVESSGLKRVRSFKTTSKGLIKKDSYTRSSNSLAGSNPSLAGTDVRRGSQVSTGSASGSQDTKATHNVYRVLMMGPPGVGKTALMRQFMTSEYKGTYSEATSPEISEPERNVTVALDNSEEAVLHFLDEEQHPNFAAEDISIDAYVIVFSCLDTASYNQAIKSLRVLKEVHSTTKAVILVGNKIDIARQRRVASHDAVRVARKFGCRYAETSAALNHHVDELLVGILSEIREQQVKVSSGLAPPSDGVRGRSKSPAKAITDFFSKIMGHGDKKAKSSETLFVQ